MLFFKKISFTCMLSDAAKNSGQVCVNCTLRMLHWIWSLDFMQVRQRIAIYITASRIHDIPFAANSTHIFSFWCTGTRFCRLWHHTMKFWSAGKMTLTICLSWTDDSSGFVFDLVIFKWQNIDTIIDSQSKLSLSFSRNPQPNNTCF